MLVDAQGRLWWVAQDVCTILDIRNVSDALRRLREQEKGIASIYTLGGQQNLLTVNEPGLYRLIFRSDKPQATAFQDWVFADVLPTLRRTGTYTLPQGHAQPPPRPSDAMPPPRRPVRERAEISPQLIAVWTTFRQTDEPLNSRELAVRAGVAYNTARQHAKYLLDLGLLDLYETFPRHLYALAAQAEKRHTGYFQRLELIAQVLERRTQLAYPAQGVCTPRPPWPCTDHDTTGHDQTRLDGT